MAIRSSGRTGFISTASIAPSTRAIRSSLELVPVSAMIGTLPAGPASARMRRAASTPSIPGMWMSISTRSNIWLAARSIAA